MNGMLHITDIFRDLYVSHFITLKNTMEIRRAKKDYFYLQTVFAPEVKFGWIK